MEIRQLRSFQTVARLLSFNKAAGQLHYAQSSISSQIRILEEELGVLLFDRLGRKVALTEIGEMLLPYADKILDLAEEAQAKVSAGNLPAGSLTIRIPESFGVYQLPAIIKKFHSQYPQVRLNFTTCTHEGLEKDLRKGITDLAFLFTDSINSSDLAFETLGFQSIVLVAGMQHPLAAKKKVHTRDLAGETILLSKVDCSYRKVFQRILKEEEVGELNIYEYHSIETLKQSIKNGIGVTVLPRIAVEHDVVENRLTILPWNEEKFDVGVLMIWYKDRWLSPSLIAFMDVAKSVLAGNGGLSAS